MHPDFQSNRLQTSNSSFSARADGLETDENLLPLSVLTTAVISAKHMERWRLVCFCLLCVCVYARGCVFVLHRPVWGPGRIHWGHYSSCDLLEKSQISNDSYMLNWTVAAPSGPSHQRAEQLQQHQHKATTSNTKIVLLGCQKQSEFRYIKIITFLISKERKDEEKRGKHQKCLFLSQPAVSVSVFDWQLAGRQSSGVTPQGAAQKQLKLAL